VKYIAAAERSGENTQDAEGSGAERVMRADDSVFLFFLDGRLRVGRGVRMGRE
jgi:hypothetical protein